MPRTDPTPAPQWPSRRKAWTLVAVLMAAYTCAFVDRQILTLLVEPIRRDLGISDTQFSLLTGVAFMIFYTGLGMPLAWVADRGNRRSLIMLGMAVWSAMTAACGLANGFWGLFAARIGVGAGEAALSPAAYSMIADSFPPAQRARAMAVYALGAIAGAGLALMIGGAVIQWANSAGPVVLPGLGQVRTWQLAFFIVSLPGLFILALMQLVREPRRHEAPVADGPPVTMRAVLQSRASAFFLATFGYSLLGVVIASYMAWAPTILIRTFGWTPAQAGLAFGAMLLFGCTSGVVAGGWIADKMAAAGKTDALLRTAIGGGLAAFPFAVAMPFASNDAMAAVLLTGASFSFGVMNGLTAPTFQAMAPNRLRARIFALYFLFANPIAFIAGPTGVALISDKILHDPQKIGTALAIVSAIVLPIGMALLAAGLAPFRRCVEATLLEAPAAAPAFAATAPAE
jgi:MFS family permease